MSTAHRNHTRVIGLLAILALLVAVLAMTVSAAEADKEVRVEMTIGQTAYTVNGTEKTMDSSWARPSALRYPGTRQRTPP